MRIERYYSSVREELSSLSDDALTLLDRQDYIGFFKSCGPNYIRSIRRAQEITAIFEFNESSSEKSSEVAVKIQATTGGDTNKLTRRDVIYFVASRIVVVVPFLFLKGGTRVFHNVQYFVEDINILVDKRGVNVGVEIVAMIDMAQLVGVIAMGGMLEGGEIVYTRI